MELKTIYATHYFHGEYDIRELIQLADFQDLSKEANRCWSGVAMDGSTMQELYDLRLLDKIGLKIIQNKFGVTFHEDDAPETIISLQFYDYTDKSLIAKKLEIIARNIESHSGGDDDFFDYCPGTVDTLCELIEKLGFKDQSDLIQAMMEEKGHNY